MPPFMRFRALFSPTRADPCKVHITFSCLGTRRLRYLPLYSRSIEEVAYMYVSSPCLVCYPVFMDV